MNIEKRILGIHFVEKDTKSENSCYNGSYFFVHVMCKVTEINI